MILNSFHYCVMTAAALFLLGSAAPVALGAPDGPKLYQQHCGLCHGPEGRGITGVFPPLAASDFLVKEREKSLRAPLEGLSGKIMVNRRRYETAMPPVALNDEQLVAVFGYIFTSWGNTAPAPTRDEITALRAKTKYKTFEALIAATGHAQLPPAPEGWELSVGVELGFSPVRLLAHPDGEQVLMLALSGDIWVWKPGSAEPSRLYEGAAYLDAALGDAQVMGLTVDKKGRLYVVANQRHVAVKPVQNEVTIFRSPAWSKDGGFGKLTPWLRTAYPFGVGPYNHGVSCIAQGPDGKMYVNSGSRTDGGEPGTSPNYDKSGENEMTACMWQLDPEAEKPAITVYAKGMRNSFGFCWDDEGRMIATENGPDAHAPEELNWIEQGKHYGFPYQFSDWTGKAYPHTPAMPEGLAITKPLRNVGPDGGGGAMGLATFDAHSSPAGIVWLGKDWPAPLGGSFLTARYGNLLDVGGDTGFDILQLTPDFAARTVGVKRLLSPLARPIDIVKLSGHRLAIAEFCHGTTLAAGIGTPGRIVMMTPKAAGKEPAAPKIAP